MKKPRKGALWVGPDWKPKPKDNALNEWLASIPENQAMLEDLKRRHERTRRFWKAIKKDGE